MGARGPRAYDGGAPGAGVVVAAACVGGGGAGTGAKLGGVSRVCPGFASSVSVLARAGVGTVCSTLKLVGESSLITVSVPSPWELNVSIVAGLKVAPSHPLPMGRSVMMCPSVAERMIMFLLSRQAAKRMLFFASSARPAQPPPLLETSYLPTIFRVLASMTAMADLSSMST